MSRLRELTRGIAIYGAGDVAIQALNFLLLPLYVTYLTQSDYGVIALLAAVEAPAKLLYRWGLDGAFMRFWYDSDDEQDRRVLTSTLLAFIVVVNGLLLALSIVAAPLLAAWLEIGTYTTALQLVLLNTFAIGFTFIPFHVLRMENRPGEFSAIAFGRSMGTLLLRLLLVVGFGMGVMGIVVTDVVVTLVLLIVLRRWFLRLVRPVVSGDVLRKALAFGLPRVPHGLALQLMAVADRVILKRFYSDAVVGMYSMGVSFGLVPKFALAAFETAWAPFYYATARQADAQRVFAAVATYGVAILALMTAGLAAIATDILDVMTRGRFIEAAPVVRWIGVGTFFYGIYLLTSIGLNITSRTRYYPVSTLAGAVLNVVLNLVLVPIYGMIGAAWASAGAYALQCAVAFMYSQRFYPIAYEWGRFGRAISAAALGYLAASLLPQLPSVAGVVARGGTVVAIMALGLWATGFFKPDEWHWLSGLIRNRRRAPIPAPAVDATEMAGEIVSVDVQQDPPPSERTR